MTKNYFKRWSKVTLILFLLVPMFAFAQIRYTIKGKITDGTGEALIGASVNIGGTLQGATTDLEGNYILSGAVREGSYSLVASYIGFAAKVEQITINEASKEQNVDFQLAEDRMNLDEVVVTGSTLRSTRRSLGNTINSVSAAQLEKTGSTNLVSSLQGKVPGAQITQNSGDPYGGITIRLRGIKSIQGSSDPLYVIDGVIVNNNSNNVSQAALANQVGAASIGTNRLADIDPSEIESINVINGAAAAAQYGSRAANGVVLITTKRGISGKPRISLTSSWGMNELRKKLPISTYGKQFGFPSLRLHTIGVPTAAQITANPGTTTTDVVRDGATSKLASNIIDVTRYDYQDLIYQTGMSNNNNLSISGGNDKTTYYVSTGFSKNEGIIIGTDMTRYNFRTRIDQRLTNWAKLSAGLSYINSKTNEKANGNVFYSPINSVVITNNNTDARVLDANGNLQAVELTRVNPLSTINDMAFSTGVNRTINDLQLTLFPIKNMTIDWVIGVDAASSVGRGLIKAYPYQPIAGLPLERYPNGYASTNNNVDFQFNNDINITYDWNLNKDLNLKLIGGTNYQYQRSDLSRSSGELLSPFIETVSGAATTVLGGYDINRSYLNGEFVQGTFGYKNFAYVTGAVRRDRSSKFSPQSVNQIYPKVSASVVASDLGFWKSSGINKVADAFKLRFSWGEAGNLNGIGAYDRFWQFNARQYLNKATLLPSSTLANPDVRPERMTETEYGVDLGLFKSRITLSATAYQQTINDLVLNRALAPTAGGTGFLTSFGSMENKGIELGLGITPVRTKDFNWDINVMFNQNRNKVLDIDGNPNAIGTTSSVAANSAGAPVFLIDGQPASVFYGFPYARDANGNLLETAQKLPQRERGVQNDAVTYTAERDANGQPKGTFVRGIIGNPNPDWTGAVSTSLTWKGLSLNALLDAVQGADVFNANRRTIENVGIGPLAEKELKGELPRGHVFSLVNIEEFRVEQGDFIKLREISLSYKFPKFIKGVEGLTLSLVGRNLYSWDNYSGQDPETNAGGNSDLLRGIDFGNVPIPRTYMIQLNANF
jgi:TonB-linked SusC/RagA family outer membrane protein